MTDERTHALYRFYDATGTLLYIGITLDPGSRWRSHAHDKPWWHQVVRVDLEILPSRTAVLAAERAAIITERPLHNVVHNRPAQPGRPVRPARLPRAEHGDVLRLFAQHRECPHPHAAGAACTSCGHQPSGCRCTRILEVAFS